MDIALPNRYGYKNFIRSTADDVWVLNLDPEGAGHLRVIYDDNEMSKIFAVDPAGGPMIYKGGQISIHGEMLEVKSISNVDNNILILIQ